MKYRPALLLRLFCIWTVFVWAVLVKNMILDDEHPLSFRLVHIGLAAVSFVFVALVWPAAKRLSSSSS